MSPARTTDRRLHRRAFTLAEAAVSLAVMAILLLGMAGALVMTVSASDKGSDRSAKAVAAAAAADMVLADLAEASEISADTEEGVSLLRLTVSDRDGDTEPDIVEYAWPGAAATGSRLYRSVNDSARQTIATSVAGFQVDLIARSGPPITEGSEQVLLSYDTSLGASIKTWTIGHTTPMAQYIKPAFNDNTSSWSITRVRLRLSSSGVASGKLRVVLVKSSDWTPTGDRVSELEVSESSLPSFAGWVDVAVSAGPLLPNEGVFILLEDTDSGGDGAAIAEYGQGGASMPYNTYFSGSNDKGITWSAPQDTRDARFFAYGTVSTY